MVLVPGLVLGARGNWLAYRNHTDLKEKTFHSDFTEGNLPSAPGSPGRGPPPLRSGPSVSREDYFLEIAPRVTYRVVSPTHPDLVGDTTLDRTRHTL